MPRILRFDKSYKLKSKKAIDLLFQKGKSLYKYPLKVQYIEITSEADQDIKFAVTVPKKRFKLAVDRNRLKRKIREAYRLNFRTYLNTPIQEESLTPSYLAVMFIYVSNEKINYRNIEQSMIFLLKELAQKTQL